MKTNNFITGVTYNSEKFLLKKLNELYKMKVIAEWYYIPHKAEEEELKDHFHVGMLPRSPINPFDLKDEFDEFVKKEKLPRKLVLSERTTPLTPISEWFMYILHTPEYCKKKKLIKKYTYDRTEIKSHDKVTLDNRLFTAFHESTFNEESRILDILRSGITIGDLARNGFISPSKAFQYYTFDKLLQIGSSGINPDIAITDIVSRETLTEVSE